MQDTHGVDAKTSLVNNVKSTYANKAPPAKRGRPRGAAKQAVPTSTGGSLAVDDIVAVKELVDRFGKESLTRLVEVL